MAHLERGRANEELVCENPQSPEIDLGVVLFPFDHLGW
jgi:hypothetical protein